MWPMLNTPIDTTVRNTHTTTHVHTLKEDVFANPLLPNCKAQHTHTLSHTHTHTHTHTDTHAHTHTHTHANTAHAPLMVAEHL